MPDQGFNGMLKQAVTVRVRGSYSLLNENFGGDSMKYILFSIGSFHVYGYGFMIALGVLAALGMGMYRAKKHGLDPDLIFNLTFICVIGGFLGAKLLFIITELPDLLKSENLLRDLSNGFVVYGGIIGGILVAWLYCRYKKMNFLKYFDVAMPSVALAQGFGRIGCFLAGCCYGKAYRPPIGMVFGESPFAPNDVAVIPTQLISSAGDFLIAGLLVLLARKKRRDGWIGCLYLLLYGSGRFLVEILRDDPRGNVGPLSTSQFISVLVVAVASVWMWRICKKENSDGKNEQQ